MSIMEKFSDVKSALVEYAALAAETLKIQDANILEAKKKELSAKRKTLESLRDHISLELENVDLFLTTTEENDVIENSVVIEELRKSRPGFKGLDEQRSRANPKGPRSKGIVHRINNFFTTPVNED